jgi:hypothetical protein
MATQLVEKELWKNVAPGLRYYMILDVMGNQTHAVVQPGRTFSISPLERQLNQSAAYDPKADLFRNGTFVIVKKSGETIADEIESPNSISDQEIEDAVAELLGGDSVPIELMLERVSSAVTAQRLLEELGPDGQPMAVVERETISSSEADPEDFRASKAVRPR